MCSSGQFKYRMQKNNSLLSSTSVINGRKYVHLKPLLLTKIYFYIINSGHFFLILTLLLFFTTLFISSSSQATLQAKTSRTIQGKTPVLQGIPEENLSFSIDNGVSYYSAAMNNVPSVFSLKLSFSDFTAQALSDNDYYDMDGDLQLAAGAVISTPTIPTISWQDDTGIIIPVSDYNKSIGCSGYKLPLKLAITASNIVVSSQYGDPSVNHIGTLTKTYSINPSSGICSIKPNGMIVSPNSQWMGWNGSVWGWNSGAITGDGGGYSADFDPDNGFKPEPTVASSTFPTTGFPQAKFQMVMSGGNAGYTFSTPIVSPDGAVTVDELGNVTLVSKPSGNVTIRAVSGAETHDYTFNIGLWVLPYLSQQTYQQAVIQCGSESNLLTRAEMTNSPYNTAPMGWTYRANYSTRAIGAGVISEWGAANTLTYPGSQWRSGYSWTSELYKTNYHFIFDAGDGRVSYATNSYAGSTVCRG